MAASTTNITGTSADDAIQRFDTAEAAAKYRAGLTDTPSHRREMRCIQRALKDVPRGARVLDLPCGTGRLLPELTAMGFNVTAADVSPHMIDHARTFAAARGTTIPDNRYCVASVFSTPFADGEFDAVVCNRLFHHFFEPDVRQSALRELKRISRGPIIVSFFNSRSFLGCAFHARDRMRKTRARDRVPISPRMFTKDAEAAGLTVRSLWMTRPGISKQCYALLSPA